MVENSILTRPEASCQDLRRRRLGPVTTGSPAIPGVRSVAPGFSRGSSDHPMFRARLSGRQALCRPLKRADNLGYIGNPRLKPGATVLAPASPATPCAEGRNNG